jgi:hypothetical protein
VKSPKNPQDVIDACTEYEKFWKPRDDRAKKALETYHMYDKLEMAKKANDKAYYISNDARTLAETVISLISRNEPWPRIPITTESQEDRKLISQIERMCIGIKRMADEQMRQQWRGNGIMALCAKNAVLRGWYGACQLLIDDEGEISIKMFDPIEFFPELGPDRPRRIIHKYVMTVSEAMDEWAIAKYQPVSDKVKTVTVYDDWFYDDDGNVLNGVVIQDAYGNLVGSEKQKANHYVKEPTIVEGLRRIPIIMGPITGTTIRSDTVKGVKWQATIGQDIYSMNMALSSDGANIYEQFNHYMSLVLELVDKAANRGLIGFSPSGDLTADRIDERAGGFTSLKTTERLEAQPYVTAPIEVNRIAADLAAQLQRGGISWALTGQVPFEMSGYALDKLISSAMIVLNAFIDGQKSFIKDFWGLFLEQYKDRGQKPVTFFGELKTGTLFEEEFKPEMLTKKYYIEPDLQAALPEDAASKAAIGAQWRQIGIDVFTIMEEVLHTQDPDLLDERKLREVAMSLEPIALRRIEAAFEAAGEMEKAKFVKEYRIMKELELSARFETTMQGLKAQYKALTQPSQMPPGILPPEAQGTPEPTKPPVTERPTAPPGVPGP